MNIELITIKAEELYKEETGYTPKEHFRRDSVILTDREDRNTARRRFNEIVDQVTKEME